MKSVPAMIIALLALIGCREPRVSEVLKDLSGSRYLRVAAAKDYSIEIRLMPRRMSVVALAGLEPGRIVTPELLDSLDRNAGLALGVQFYMRISPNDSTLPSHENDLIYGSKNGFDSYQAALLAYQDGLARQIWAEASGKKYALSTGRMVNNYGLGRGREFVLVFPEGVLGGEGAEHDLTIVLDDLVPGLGRSRLTWNLNKSEYENSI